MPIDEHGRDRGPTGPVGWWDAHPDNPANARPPRGPSAKKSGCLSTMVVIALLIGGLTLFDEAKEFYDTRFPEDPLDDWVELATDHVDDCDDAEVQNYPVDNDVTGDGQYETFVTLYCGGDGDPDHVLVFADAHGDDPRFLGSITSDLPVLLRGGGCVRPGQGTATVYGRMRADGDPADRPSLVVTRTATWNGSSFTFGAPATSPADPPGFGPTLPGCA